MLPEISLHRPRGIVPKVAIRKRTVVDYQPSWLLLAVPAVAAMASRRKRSRADSSSLQRSSGVSTDDQSAGAETGRRRRVVVVLTGLRRRPGASLDPYDSDTRLSSPGTRHTT